MTEVTLVQQYNPEWPSWFLQLHALLGRTLAGHFYAIEHFGSTSVPGMVAKPIIDVYVVAREGEFKRIKAFLAPLGYEHEGDLGIPTREAFRLNGPLADVLPRHHLYVCEGVTDDLRRVRAFRDYLIAHVEARERLSEHKWQLAQQVDNDLEGYIEGKSAMVQEILAAALAEQGAAV